MENQYNTQEEIKLIYKIISQILKNDWRSIENTTRNENIQINTIGAVQPSTDIYADAYDDNGMTAPGIGYITVAHGSGQDVWGANGGDPSGSTGTWTLNAGTDDVPWPRDFSSPQNLPAPGRDADILSAPHDPTNPVF